MQARVPDMTLAISNIAWAPKELDDALAIVQEAGARGLEIAPGLSFPDEADAFEPSPGAVSALLEKLSAYGVELVSMQSLLFGVNGAKLFGTPAETDAFQHGIGRAIGLAGILAIPNLVMGSPKNRAIPEGMDRDAAWQQARDTFRQLGDQAAEAGTVIALEPNPAAYGTNFMTHIHEAGEFCRFVCHPAVTVNFDIGAMQMNGEFDEAADRFDAISDVVSHVHISEPQLAPAPRDADGLKGLAAHLIGAGYDRWMSIEMRRVEEDPLGALRTSLNTCAKALSSIEDPS